MTEPTRLTYEQFLPLAVALHRRETATQAGAGFLLPPFPACPDCGQAPTELLVNSDHPAHLLEDRVVFGFRPCGHTFTVDGDDLHRAREHARRESP